MIEIETTALKHEDRPRACLKRLLCSVYFFVLPRVNIGGVTCSLHCFLLMSACGTNFGGSNFVSKGCCSTK